MTNRHLGRFAARGAVCSLACCCCLAWGDPSRLEVDAADGLVSLRADEVPLRQVLEAIAVDYPLDVFSQVPLEGRVRLAVNDQPLQSLIRRLLRGHSFIFVDASATGRQPSRLWILQSDEGDAVAAEPWYRLDPEDDLDGALVAAQGPEPGQRVLALTALAVIGGDDASLAAATLLNDGSAAVREEALYALGAIDGDGAVAQIVPSLNDADPGVREAAVATLADLGSREGLTALGQVLAGPDIELRIAAVEELADSDDPLATELLQRAARDSSPRIAASAAEYLSERADSAGTRD